MLPDVIPEGLSQKELAALYILYDVEPPSAAGLEDRIPIVTYVDDRLQLGIRLKDIANELFIRAGVRPGNVVALKDLFESLRYSQDILLLENEQRRIFQKLVFGAAQKGYVRKDEFMKAFVRWLLWIHENERGSNQSTKSRLVLPAIIQGVTRQPVRNVLSHAFEDHERESRTRFLQALQSELPELRASVKHGKPRRRKQHAKQAMGKASTGLPNNRSKSQAFQIKQSMQNRSASVEAPGTLPSLIHDPGAEASATAFSLVDCRALSVCKKEGSYQLNKSTSGAKVSCTNAQRVEAMRAMGKNCRIWRDFPAINRTGH